MNKELAELQTNGYKIALTFGGIIFKAYIATILWGWFIIPIFNAPDVGVAEMVGVLTVVGLFFKAHYKEGEPESTMKQIFINAAVMPTIGLSIGWVALLFV